MSKTNNVFLLKSSGPYYDSQNDFLSLRTTSEKPSQVSSLNNNNSVTTPYNNNMNNSYPINYNPTPIFNNPSPYFYNSRNSSSYNSTDFYSNPLNLTSTTPYPATKPGSYPVRTPRATTPGPLPVRTPRATTPGPYPVRTPRATTPGPSRISNNTNISNSRYNTGQTNNKKRKRESSPPSRNTRNMPRTYHQRRQDRINIERIIRKLDDIFYNVLQRDEEISKLIQEGIDINKFIFYKMMHDVRFYGPNHNRSIFLNAQNGQWTCRNI